MKRKRRFSERLLAILLALVLAVPMLMEPAAVSLGAEMGSVDVQNLDTGNGDPAEGGDGTGATPTSPSTVTPGTTPVTTPEVTPEPTEPEPIQYYSISGNVICGNNQPVAGAEVKENNSGMSTTTNEDGAFVINNIPSTVTEYNLTAEKNGFEITGSSTGNMEGNVSNVTLTMTLVSPSYTIDGKREVDSQLTLKVDNPAADIIYSWEFDDAIFQPSSGESIPVKGTPVTGTLVKSGNLNVSLTASYGTASTLGTGEPFVEILKRTPTVNLIVTPTSQDAEAGIKELTVIAEVDRVRSEGRITFSEGNGKGTFEANDISVVNGAATTTYKASEGADGFDGELSFTAEYSGVDEKYNSSKSATVTGTYNSEKSITWLEKDIYGNALNPAATDSNAVTIEYGSVYIAPESKEEKINYYQIPVNKDALPAGTYTYDAVDASSSPIEADKLPFMLDGQTGELQITRAMTADEQIFVRVTRRSDGYADAVATLKLTISPRKIILDKEKTVFVADKTYDGTTATGNTTDFAIKVSGTPSFKRDNGMAVLDGEEVTIASVSGTLDTDKVNASTYESEILQNVEIVLGGRNAQNYELTVENKSVDAEYTIKPKEYHVRINQAQRVYGTTDKYTVAPTLSQDQETGFLSDVANAAPDWEAIAKNITLQDSSTEVSPMETMRPEAQDNHYIYAVVLDENAGNYSIVNDDTNNVYRGELIINQQLIAEDEIEEYVQIRGTVTGQDGNIWLKGKYDDNPGELKLASNKNIYSGISVKDGTGYVIKEGTTDTVLIPLAQGEVDFKGVEIIFTLVNKDGNDNQISETNEMKLLVKVDSEYPEVRISEPEELAVTPLESLANILTFGLFKNNRYAVTANVSDQGAGVRSWSYAVIDTDHSMTPDELRSKVNSGISWTAGNEEPITVYKGDIPADEVDTVLENRIVLISATDNVGNSVIYASNGVVIENYLPVITIKDLKAGYGMTDSIDFYLSVTDAVASDTENKVVSGISSITCTWEFTDREGNLIAGAEGQASWTGELVEQPLTIQLPEGEAREDCKVLTLTIQATDKAGNTQTVNPKIIVDQTAPTWQWTKAPEQGAYVQEASLEVNIKERYFVSENAVLTISHDGNETTIPLSEGGNDFVTIAKVSDSQESVEDPVDYTDARENLYSLTFNEDGAYEVSLNVTDQYGNTSPVGETRSFVLDQTIPEIAISYDDEVTENTAANERYFQQGRTASVIFTERNIDLEKSQVEVTATDVDSNEKMTGIWTLQQIKDGEARNEYLSVENVTDSLDTDETPDYPENNRTISFDLHFAGEANYTLKLLAVDLSGASVEAPGQEQTDSPLYRFTVDGTAPEGSISAMQNTWELFVEAITFGLFSANSQEVSMTGTDETAGVFSLEYVVLEEILTKDELISRDAQGEIAWEMDEEGRAPAGTVGRSCTRDPNSRNIIYTKVTDYADNTEYFSSEGFILDSTVPQWTQPEVLGINQAESGIFHGDVSLKIDVQDPDTSDDSYSVYSGLKNIWYEVTDRNNGKTIVYDLMKDGVQVAAEENAYIDSFGTEVSDAISDGAYSRVQRVQAQVTIPAEEFNSNDVTVQFYAQDNADNIQSSEITELMIDITSPEVTVEFTGNVPVRNYAYFQSAREAVLTFKDRNIDMEDMGISISAENFEGAAQNDESGTYSLQNLKDGNANTLFTVKSNSYVDSQGDRDPKNYSDERTVQVTVVFNPDAVYRIEDVHCMDQADLTAQNTVYEGQEPYQEFTVDHQIPEGTVSVSIGKDSVWENLWSVITFGLFSNKEEETVTITAADEFSPIEKIQYVVLPEIISTEEAFRAREAEFEGQWQEWTGSEDANELTRSFTVAPNDKNVVYVKITDFAGNVQYISSDGFIMDDVAPEWKTIKVLDTNQTASGIYNGDVSLQIEVYDPDTDNGAIYSGLKEIYYVVKDINEEEVSDRYDILVNGEPVSNEYVTITAPEYPADAGDPDVSPETDGEFVRIERLTADITIPSTYNSNGLYVEFYAVDWAGNILSDETIADRTAEFSIDMTAPAVSIAYDRNDPENGRYFDGNREAVITFRERNFDPARVSMDLTVEGVRHTDTLDNLMKTDIVDFQGGDAMDFAWETDSQSGRELRYYTDDRTDELKVTFKGNASYAIHSVTITDAADNSFTAAAGNLVYEDTAAADLAPEVFAAPTATAAAMDFVVDKVRPVMAVSYPTDIESATHKAYYFKEMTATFTVNEHNFDQSVEAPAFVITAKDLAGNTVTENTVKASSWTSRGDERTYTITFRGNANYTYEATYKDLAGNTLSAPFADVFTVDKSAPETATVQIHDHGIWHQFLADITFGLFDNQPVLVTMSGRDGNDGNIGDRTEPAISPVEPLQYYKSTRMMTWAELENLPASAWITGNRLTVNPNQQFIIYEKVTNYANLTSYFSSNGMVVDNTKPVPEITITNLSQAQNGIFNEDVVLRIDVEDPTAGDTYSGLEEVWYTVTASGNVSRAQTVTLLDNTGNRVQGNKTFSQIVTIDAETFNSNDVRVQAFARDFSANEAESEITELKIDVTEPRISVTWDLNDPLNGRYYKDTRTATVTVTDRNFDPDQVRFDITNTDGTSASIGGWSSSSNIGVSDEATTTCRVSFPADGDYTFTLGCTDLAGNSTEYGQTDEFTIDKTVPEIEVSYDNNSAANGEYYNEERTATIRIHEHNFNASDVQAAITASLEGQGISAPSVGGFSGSGDVHTATVTYDTDGDYTFDIEYTDMAGNVAEDYTPDSFTVDLTAPEVEIFDIEDKSANNDVVAPGIRYTDINYDADGVTITLEGANNGLVNVGSVTSSIDNGQSIKFNDFAREERMDDLYQLTAKITDLAGNETEETVLFSVNRYGSVYVLDEATAGWLSTDPESSYTYINQEREIGVQEYNVDDIEEYGIAVNRDGELAQLQEGTDFTVTRSGSDVQWKVYHYTMNAENFADEGNYTVTLSSRDMAANSMNNETAKKSDGQLPLQFTVDKTAPTVVVSGVEDGGQYRAAARVMTVDAKDNLALSRVTVRIGDDTQVYEAEELRETDGIIRTEIPSANSWQDIEVTAEDAAGNQLGQTEVGSEAVPVMMAVLVTPNILIQYYMNKPVFYGSIVIVLLIIAAAVILVRRRLKDR